MLDLHINIGHILVSVVGMILTFVMRWAVNTLKHDRKAVIAAINRLDYVDTIACASYKVLSVKYPAEAGIAVQEILQNKASATQKADRLAQAMGNTSS